MFGGEYWDGKQDKMHVYNDLFLYSTSKGNWKQIISPHGWGLLPLAGPAPHLFVCFLPGAAWLLQDCHSLWMALA